MQGDFERAAAYLHAQQEKAALKDERAFFYLGNAYAHLGRKAEAQTAYEKAIQLNPGFYEPRANLEALGGGQRDTNRRHYAL